MNTLKSMMAAAALALFLITGPSAVAALFDFSNGGSGTLYTGSGSSLGLGGLGQVIPDNTPAGVGYSLNFAPVGLQISAISVTLNISGGYNGDIFAYVSHGGQKAVLLNANPVVSGSGFNVTFIPGDTHPIPAGGSGVLGGELGASYTGVDNLSVFNNTDPNGDWTLFFADLSPGDTSLLNSFSVGITAVPEPVNVALGIFGVVLGVGGFVRRYWRTGKAAAI